MESILTHERDAQNSSESILTLNSDALAVELKPVEVATATVERDDFADRLLKEAASWIGTPFSHQGKIKQVGVDCANFVDACFRAAGADTKPIPSDYKRQEDGSLMLKILEEKLIYVPWEFRGPGDVVAFCDEACREKDKPTHIAFIDSVTSNTTFIYEAGRLGCVRHRLNGMWNLRVHSVWRHPR